MGMPEDEYLYRIRFTDEVLRKLKPLEQDEDMHEALSSLIYSIRHNPMAFPFQLPLTLFRVAKTVHYERNGRILPKVILFFQIIPDDREVFVINVHYKPFDGEWHL